MNLLAELAEIHRGHELAFLIDGDRALVFEDVVGSTAVDLSEVSPGDVVALIGDFEPRCINTMLRLIDLRAILVPLTVDTRPNHDYFFDAAAVDVVIEGERVKRVREAPAPHPMLDSLRRAGHPGLVLFSSGTTGRPKAILHDFEAFLVRYRTVRPALRTLNFLLFDHIGGINTLIHTLYNRGVVTIPTERMPDPVWRDIERHDIELLPTTPTFLRMMLMSGVLDKGAPPSLKVITYGTERMDQGTLDRLAALLPTVDLRQTYGMSELGILRVRSKARDSLWMKVGGEGVETKVVETVLHIRSANRMIGYLNAPSPFDEDGWYDTKDIVEQDGDWLRIVGRTSDVISVGGIKVLPQEIERAALTHPAVVHASAHGVDNPITGQHIELICEARPGAQVDRKALRRHMKRHVPDALMPHRIKLGAVAISHRFKRS